MSVLLLKLAGPLQAWGDSSRFVRRETGPQPTKSGIVGLLAASMGRRRTDEIEDLAELTFGVRIEQPGALLRDFQTARSLDGSRTMPLSTRYYLSDAVFLAAVEGPTDLITGIAECLQRPMFPLYLGRRSCPPSEPVSAPGSVRDGSLLQVLVHEPWRAARWHRRRVQSHQPRLAITVDETAARAEPDLLEDRQSARIVRDQPISFDPRLRQYGFRSVVRGSASVVNPDFMPPVDRAAHDPMAELGA